MKVVLCEWRDMKVIAQNASLGIQYLASALRQAGHPVDLFLFEGESVESVCNSILAANPDIFGIAATLDYRDTIFSILKTVKEKKADTQTITGGPYATLWAAKILAENPFIDFVLCGEAEETIVDLCNKLENGQKLNDCPGIFYRENGYTNRTNPRDVVEDLDQITFPALDIVKVKNPKSSPCAFASISTSRGCLGDCSFCVCHRVSRLTKCKKWYGRSPANVIEELKHIRKEFPDKRLVVDFVDSSFEDPDPIKKKRIIEFLDLLESNDLKIAFSILTRAESWSPADSDLLRRMKKLGLFFVAPGIESASDSTLALFGKLTSSHQNRVVCDLFTSHEMGFHILLIMFHPYVTFDDLRDNADLLYQYKNTAWPYNWYHSLIIYPDTRIFSTVTRDGLILGLNEKDYTYLYDFQDGRVKRVFNATQKLKSQPETQMIQTYFRQMSFEIYLYDVWKNQYEDMLKINDIMKTYKDSFIRITDELGTNQYELFLELITAAENDKPKSNDERILEIWHRMMEQMGDSLKQLWLSNQASLARMRMPLL